MVPFSTTLSDLWPTFQGHDNIQRQINRLIVSRVWSTQWFRFQWPWVTLNLDFKVTEMPSTNCVRSWRAICMQQQSSCSRSRQQPLSSTSVFVFVDVLAFRRSKSIKRTKFRRHISIYGWDITTSCLEKQTSAILQFGCDLDHFPVICILFCISQPNFVQIKAAAAEIWHHIALSRWRPHNTISGIAFVNIDAFRRSKSISKPNFVDINQFMAKTFWNSTSGFDLDHLTIICILFSTPNFVQIAAPIVEIWRNIHLSRWRLRPLNNTSAFVFVYVTAFRMSKSISKPNFVNISQLPAEIGLLPFLKTKVHHTGILLPVSISTIWP